MDFRRCVPGQVLQLQIWLAVLVPFTTDYLATGALIKPGNCDGLDHNCDHLCTSFHDNYMCSCNHGYVLAADGRTCADVDECQEFGPCQHICSNTDGGFTCVCQDGYHMDDNNRTCSDVDECSLPGTCMGNTAGPTCVNVPGTYLCIDSDMPGPGATLADTGDTSVQFDQDHKSRKRHLSRHILVSEPQDSNDESNNPDLTSEGATAVNRSKVKVSHEVKVAPKCETAESRDDNSGISSGDLAVLSGCFIAIIGLMTTFVIIFAVASWKRKQQKTPHLFSSPATTTSSMSTSSLSSELSPNLRRVWPKRQRYAKRHQRRPSGMPSRLPPQDRIHIDRQLAEPDITDHPCKTDSNHGNLQHTEPVPEFI